MKARFLVLAVSFCIWGSLYADAMFGAFKVITKPSGADVTLYEPDLYLAQTPTPVYPVVMDEYMELREGIPGRAIPLIITHKGYLPLQREIFVPFTHEADSLAIAEPSIFTFELEADLQNTYWRVCVYYSYPYRYPRPHYHAYYHPWYPPPVYYHPSWHHHPPHLKPRPTVYPGDIVSGGSQQGPQFGTASGNKLKPKKPQTPKFEQKDPPPASKPATSTKSKSPGKTQKVEKQKPDKTVTKSKAEPQTKAKPEKDTAKVEASKNKPEKQANLSTKPPEEQKDEKSKPKKSK